MAQLTGYSLSAFHAFYLATRGAAEALYLEDQVGSVAPGMEADLIVMDLKATPLLAHRLKYTDSLHDILFVLMTLADPRTVQATYVAGKLVANRNSGTGQMEFHPT